jgi:pimeloyl-ACP methyl ester carboxylesterase
MNTKSQLVQTKTADKLVLSGLFVEGKKDKPAVIFIHGFTTDFYTWPFYHAMADAIATTGHALILGQHRGTGVETEMTKTDGTSEYIGSFFEKLEEAHLDISAWIEFLKSVGYTKFILMGHSLGTIKAIRYLTEGSYKNHVVKLVLLAPFDKNGYVEKKTKGEWAEHVKTARSMIEQGKGKERIPDTFDDFPVTYITYSSWYQSDELGRMFDFYNPTYDFPALSRIDQPVKIIVGSNDEFFFMKELNKGVDEVEAILKSHIRNLTFCLIDGASHTYNGYEEAVAKEVAEFI